MPGCPTRTIREASLEAVDETFEVGGRLVAGLREAVPAGSDATAAELIDLAKGHPDRFPILAEAVGSLGSGRVNAVMLGKELAKYCGRNFDGWRIVSVIGRGRIKRWWVEPVDGSTAPSPATGRGDNDSRHPELTETAETVAG